MKRSLLSLLLVLVSWDAVLHNCDPLKPWTDDLSGYTYRVAMRFPEGSQTCTVCDDLGNCIDTECVIYNPFVWSPVRTVTDCVANRCSGSAVEGWSPLPGEVLVYEIRAEDRAKNEDCGPDPSSPL